MSYGRGFVGEKYASERLDVAEIAKRMRAWIKAARKAGEAGGGFDLPAEAKVSVRIERFSMGQSINIAVLADPAWVYVAPGAAADYSDNRPAHGGQTLAAHKVEAIIKAELNSYNRDDSDPQTDYFDVWFYGHVDVREQMPEGQYYLRADGPVYMGRTLDRFDARAAIDATPYMVAKAERAAYAEAERREAEAAEQAAAVDAAAQEFAAELDGDDALAGVAEAEIVAGVEVASAAEIAEQAEEMQAYADAIGDEALAEETIAREPDTVAISGRDQRSIKATWVLTWHDEARTQPHEITELTTYHHSGRGYTASLHRGTVEAPREGSMFVGTMFRDMMTAPRVGKMIEGKRFSRKALIAAAQAKLAEVQADPAQYLHKFRVVQDASVF